MNKRYALVAVLVFCFNAVGCAPTYYKPADSAGNQCKNECESACQRYKDANDLNECRSECYGRCELYNGGTYASGGCFGVTRSSEPKKKESVYQSQVVVQQVQQSGNYSQSLNSSNTQTPVYESEERALALVKAKDYMRLRFESSPKVCTVKSKDVFYNNGRIKKRTRFCDGDDAILMGLSYEYFGDGVTVKVVKSFYYGQKDGYWFEFDLNGKIKDQRIYRDNVLVDEEYMQTIISAKTESKQEEVKKEVDTIAADTEPNNEPVQSSNEKNDKNCFFDEKSKKNVCCSKGKVLDKKSKKLTLKWICDDGQVFEESFFD